MRPFLRVRCTPVRIMPPANRRTPRGDPDPARHARQRQLQRLRDLLAVVGPAATLERGYAIVSTADDGRIIRSTADLRSGQLLRTQVADGSFDSEVRHVGREDDDEAPGKPD